MKRLFQRSVEFDDNTGATDLKVDTVSEKGVKVDEDKATELKKETVSKRGREGDASSRKYDFEGSSSTKLDSKKEQLSKETKPDDVQIWAQIRPSLSSIESVISFCVKRRKEMKVEQITKSKHHLPSINEAGSLEEESEEGSKEKVRVTEMPNETVNACYEKGTLQNDILPMPYFPWKEELEFLVLGGVPKDLKGEELSPTVCKQCYGNYLIPE